MTNNEYRKLMREFGRRDAHDHLPMKYEDDPDYALGYGIEEYEENDHS